MLDRMQFEAVYVSHYASVWRCLRRFGVSEKDAQDATQEVFLTAFRRFDDFEGRSSVKTWLIGIAFRQAANYRRSTARREIPSDVMLQGIPSGIELERQLERRDELRKLDALLARLPAEQRAVFVMFELEGMSGEEIADAVQSPLGTVRSRLRLARESFQDALGSGEPHHGLLGLGEEA
jgi:RNA polymerase sigma-70 factor (ECF subfamily)